MFCSDAIRAPLGHEGIHNEKTSCTNPPACHPAPEDVQAIWSQNFKPLARWTLDERDSKIVLEELQTPHAIPFLKDLLARVKR
jgi:hypothetical protein